MGVGFSAGASNYNGDLDGHFTLRFTRLGYGVHIAGVFSRHITVRISYYTGTITAFDSLSTAQTSYRNLNFQSKITEGAVVCIYRVFGGPRGFLPRRNLTPYVFAGIAGFDFNPQGYIYGKWVDLEPIGTEGQHLVSTTVYPKPYKLQQFSIPIGVGVFYKLTEHWDLGFEVGFRKTFTDYLDDVSTDYPNKAELFAQEGQIAVDLSDRSGNHNNLGGHRGNASANDSYVYTNFNLTYYFYWSGKGRQGGKHGNDCPAFK